MKEMKNKNDFMIEIEIKEIAHVEVNDMYIEIGAVSALTHGVAGQYVEGYSGGYRPSYWYQA